MAPARLRQGAGIFLGCGLRSACPASAQTLLPRRSFSRSRSFGSTHLIDLEAAVQAIATGGGFCSGIPGADGCPRLLALGSPRPGSPQHADRPLTCLILPRHRASFQSPESPELSRFSTRISLGEQARSNVHERMSVSCSDPLPLRNNRCPHAGEAPKMYMTFSSSAAGGFDTEDALVMRRKAACEKKAISGREIDPVHRGLSVVAQVPGATDLIDRDAGLSKRFTNTPPGSARVFAQAYKRAIACSE